MIRLECCHLFAGVSLSRRSQIIITPTIQCASWLVSVSGARSCRRLLERQAGKQASRQATVGVGGGPQQQEAARICLGDFVLSATNKNQHAAIDLAHAPLRSKS